MKYDNKKIGEIIQRHRLSYRDADHTKKLSKTDFGYLVKGSPENGNGVDRGTVTDWESGKTLPETKYLFKMCELFNCDLGHLLGEYDELHRDTATISKELPLTDEAIDKLIECKWSTDKEHPGYNPELSPATNATLDALDRRQYTQPDLFIPGLISYMLTSKDFDDLVKRICAQNTALWEFSIRHEVEKEIITSAYNIALDRVGFAKADNVSLLQEKYEEAVKEYMTEHKDDIIERCPLSWVPGAYEEIFIKDMQRCFHLAHMVSERTIEANKFLNSRNLFNIVSDYMEPIKKYL